MWVTFILTNWKTMLKVAGTITAMGFIYWYLVYIPAELKKSQAETARLQNQINVSADIQKGKDLINESTYKKLSTIRATPVPHRSVLIRGGVPFTVSK